MFLDLQRQESGRSRLNIEGSVALQSEGAAPESVVLSGELVVDNLESRLLLNGTLQAVGEAGCDRCLDPHRLDFEVPVDVLVIRDAEVEDQDDSFVIHRKTGVLDLRPVLREAILLALPQKLVCREDCRGLCPQCGANWNHESCSCADEPADPRWDGLPGE